jgi:hypothetical protein
VQKYPDYKNNFETNRILGKIRLRQGNFEEALKIFLNADILSGSSNPEVKNLIGLIYFFNKSYIKASNYLGDAVNYDTSNINYKFQLVILY